MGKFESMLQTSLAFKNSLFMLTQLTTKAEQTKNASHHIRSVLHHKSLMWCQTIHYLIARLQQCSLIHNKLFEAKGIGHVKVEIWWNSL